MRAISGTADDSRSRSSQSMTMPAARAIAGRWMAWLVDPPVASRPTAALTIAFSSTQCPSGRQSLPSWPIAASRWTAARVSSCRSLVPGLTKAAPGMWRPMTSIIIWFEFAVP